MLGAIGFEILIIFILLLANGFFAASEISIVSAKRSRLELEARAGHAGARQALNLADNPDRFLATVQVGISLIGTFAAAFGGAKIGDVVTEWLRTIPAVAPYADSLGLGLVVLLLTYFSLVVGELVPKRLGLQHAERMATFAAPIMTKMAWIARPLVAVLSVSVGLVVRLLRQNKPKEEVVTEEDIAFLIQEGQSSGTVEAGEAQLIDRVFRFTDRAVRSVMTPRTEVVAVEATTPLPEIVTLFSTSAYSRIPVYQDSIDHIVGVLHAKDLLAVLQGGADEDIMRLIRPPTFVLAHQHVDDLLTIFRRQGSHLAIVIDEYGQVIGLLTMEDILEELVGEIRDEYDTPEEHPFVQRENGSWLVDAMASYDQAQQRLDLPPIPVEEQGAYTSLAGFILARLSHIPEVGETVTVGDFVIEVIDMDGRRIDKVLIRRAGPIDEHGAQAPAGEAR